jgi:hypothetical protein
LNLEQNAAIGLTSDETPEDIAVAQVTGKSEETKPETAQKKGACLILQ